MYLCVMGILIILIAAFIERGERMKKNLATRMSTIIVLLIAMLCSTITGFAGMSNFTESKPYSGFRDVSSNDWFHPYVSKSCKLGLFNGYPDGTFGPKGNITIAESIKVAAVVRATYDGETPPSNSKSDVWYNDYVAYAKAKGIIGNSDFLNYNNKAKRNEMAYIFSRALPSSEYTAINSVSTLPDVTSATKHSSNIFTLYRAGVLIGNDEYGTFRPSDYINRAEAAAIINRVAQTANREKFSLKVKVEPPATGGVRTEAQTVQFILNAMASIPENGWTGKPLDAEQKQILANIKADPRNCYPAFNSVNEFEYVKTGTDFEIYGNFVTNVLTCYGDINNFDPNIF